MASIVPSVTPTDAIVDYNAKLDRVKFAPRLHLDFGDGQFSPVKTINLIQAHWPISTQIDVHLMHADPTSQTPTLISKQPNLVIIHAESTGDLAKMMTDLKAVGIKVGVALLATTEPQSASDLIKQANHVLIFSGKLGVYGGQADLGLLAKVAQIKQINPTVEISWDGGLNDQNAPAIAAAGADVLISGGFIQQAADPKQAYHQLKSAINQQVAS